MAKVFLTVCLLAMALVILLSRVEMIETTFFDKPRVVGSNNRVEVEYPVNEFTELESSIGGSEVKVTFGEKAKCMIVADDNIHPLFTVAVKDQKLSLRSEGSFQMKGKITVALTCKKLVGTSLHGATQVTVAKQEVDKFTGSVNGASQLILNDASIKELTLEASGASSIQANGSADVMNATANGASNLKCSTLSIKNCKVQVSGSSNAQLRVSQTLNADASGASTVRYAGMPSVKQKSTGASSVKAVPEVK